MKTAYFCLALLAVAAAKTFTAKEIGDHVIALDAEIARLTGRNSTLQAEEILAEAGAGSGVLCPASVISGSLKVDFYSRRNGCRGQDCYRSASNQDHKWRSDLVHARDMPDWFGDPGQFNPKQPCNCGPGCSGRMNAPRNASFAVKEIPGAGSTMFYKCDCLVGCGRPSWSFSRAIDNDFNWSSVASWLAPLKSLIKPLICKCFGWKRTTTFSGTNARLGHDYTYTLTWNAKDMCECVFELAWSGVEYWAQNSIKRRSKSFGYVAPIGVEVAKDILSCMGFNVATGPSDTGVFERIKVAIKNALSGSLIFAAIEILACFIPYTGVFKVGKLAAKLVQCSSDILNVITKLAKVVARMVWPNCNPKVKLSTLMDAIAGFVGCYIASYFKCGPSTNVNYIIKAEIPESSMIEDLDVAFEKAHGFKVTDVKVE